MSPNRGLPAVSRLLPCAALLLACASQAPPSGGPPDRTPPTVASTTPAPDAIGTPRDGPIRVRFSEAMDRGSAEASFFLSPAPKGRIRFRWRGDEMEARPPEGFAPERTYLVSVGSGSRDEAGNPMAASHDFAFSTGDRVDTREIRGRVRVEKPGPQVYVLAYSPAEGTDPDPSLTPPDYTTQAGTDGSYRFPRLSAGRYRVFAYEDRDRDRRWSPATDPLAVPPGDVLLSDRDSVALLGDLRPVLRDTSLVRLVSARAADKTHLALRFSRPVAPPVSLAISGPSAALGVLGVHLDPSDSSRALILTGDQADGSAYRIRVLSVMAGPVGLSDPSAVFKGIGESDRTPPRLAATTPRPGAVDIPTDAPLDMIFSEPMRVDLAPPRWEETDSTQTPAGVYEWMAPDRLRFLPSQPWKPAAAHLLLAGGQALLDPAGNRAAGQIRFAFSTVDSGRLGELSGEAHLAGGLPPGSIRLIATDVQDPDRAYATELSGPSRFTLSGLPPGAYRISAFLDVDGNGRWTPGAPVPFGPAEPVFELPDPATVRPRWTTGGLDLTVEAVRYLRGGGK